MSVLRFSLFVSFLKTVLASKLQLASPKTTGSPEWPVIGGFSSQINAAENIGVERIYIAGYQDGYVRIWDSTSLVFTLISVLGFQVIAMKSI